MVLVIAALYSLAHQYRTDSGETAAEVIYRNVDSVVNSISPRSKRHSGVTKREAEAEHQLNHCEESSDSEEEDDNDQDIARPNHEMTQDYSSINDPAAAAPVAVAAFDNEGDGGDAASTITRPPVIQINPEVRQEWINAVFGKSYCQTKHTMSPPPVATQQADQRIGLAGIPTPYATSLVRIPPVEESTAVKLGITVSKLPLGLHVRRIHVHSEAEYLGVKEGSILVYVNGMCLLAESTKAALERIWQYEGYLENDSSITMSHPCEKEEVLSPSCKDQDENNNRSLREPAALTFIKDGKLSTFLFLSNPPWGISWASCGNFPLVKRVYSYAATAGVQRGSIVAAAQGKSFRTCDHMDVANILRQAFVNKQEISLTLCFPPPAARSSHFRRIMGQEDVATGRPSAPEKPPPRRVKRTDDGVEIKFHSLENTLGGLCRSVPAETRYVIQHDNGNRKLLSQVAEEVASGQIESPVLRRGANKQQLWTNRKTYSPCPKLNKEELLEVWNPIEALLYCMHFHRVAYREEIFADFLKTCPRNGTSSPVFALRDLLSGPGAPQAAGAFLLQIISVICTPSHYQESCDVREEKKESSNTASTPSIEAHRDTKELMSLLLRISRRDKGFCQRLYFLVRSYISSLETKRPSNVKGQDGSNNLLALLNCLELLRSAEKQLAEQMQEFIQPQSSTPQLPLPPTVRNTAIPTDLLFPSSTPSTIPDSTGSSANTMEEAPKAANAAKKKGIIGFLVKRSQRGSSLETRLNSAPCPNREPKTKRPFTSVSSVPPPTPDEGEGERTSRLSQVPRPPPAEDAATTTSGSPPHNTADMDGLSQSPSTMYENMAEFLLQLDRIYGTIERNLQKSFRQKIADWARQPWSASKETAVANVTTTMRQNLQEAATESGSKLLVNPVESSELLVSVDTNECYIIPSAHFPLLLTFNISENRSPDDPVRVQRIYRTTVKLLQLQGKERLRNSAYFVRAGVAGTVAASNASRSIDTSGTKQSWFSGQTLVFDTRSSWGGPQTLSLQLSCAQQEDSTDEPPRFGWVDLSELWSQFDGGGGGDEDEGQQQTGTMTVTAKLVLLDQKENCFDEQGDLSNAPTGGSLDLEMMISTEIVEFDEESSGTLARKRMLLYKHDDDLRQEVFAVEFIRTCDKILKATGLDMKLLTFQCTPVGTKRGFVEWVPGSVPLSEICQPFFDSFLDNNTNRDSSQTSPSIFARAFLDNNTNWDAAQTSPSMFAKAGLTKFESLSRIGNNHGSISRFTGSKHGNSGFGLSNPIQDYLRSMAYDAQAPYLVRRSVMDTYVKSCAGYSVITYILGVGDRHLDNLLLHQSGSFFHCDFSFLLGRDPKAFQPMRVTDDMILGMGGRDSDNYAKFLSLASAAFLALRRAENVRVLLALVRLMEASTLPDITETQPIDQAIVGMRERLRLGLSEDQAVAFMEDLIEQASSSKMWLAVDAMHSLGKKF